MKKFLAVLLFSTLAIAPVKAADVYVEYETFTSQAGESEQDFVMRVAPYLRDKTIETGWELCGALATDGERLGVVLTSSQSSLACAVRHNVLPEGMTAINRSIHSHPGPNSKDVGFTAMDRVLAEHSGHRLTLAQQKQKDRRGGGFSTQDFNSGPGYLVLERVVLFQEGFRTVKRIGRI